MPELPTPTEPAWDTSTREGFYRYYAEQSVSPAVAARFASIQDTILRLMGRPAAMLDVADIGCGAGTQARLWATAGHRVHGADINAALIALARERAAAEKLDISFSVASATALPWDDASMDVCIAPELLEHVVQWQACLAEFTRVLKPSGVLYISTSNRLCPRQEEFTLPLYSWYPGWLKRRCVRLAMTRWPGLAGHATYPAVNWFTFGQLRSHLAQSGLRSLDRFDMMDVDAKGRVSRGAVWLLRRSRGLRWLGYVMTPYTTLLAFKAGCADGSTSA